MTLRRQLLISQMIRLNDTLEGVTEDMVVVPVGETPLQFFQVPPQVLAANLVECADKRTLEKGPHALYGVGVNVAYNPFILRVVDRFVTGVMVCDSKVATEFVGIDSLCFILDRSVDEVMEGVALGIRYLLQAHGSVALDGPSNPCLVALVGPSP